MYKVDDTVQDLSQFITLDNIEVYFSEGIAIITWDAVSGAALYEIYKNGELVGTSNITSYTDIGLSKKMEYVYIVKAYGDLGSVSIESDSSTTLSMLATTISTDLTLVVDAVYEDLYLNGGTLDLNGHVLTINGNLTQYNGILEINNGILNVTGDYKIQSSSALSCPGILQMTETADKVVVGGSFLTDSRIDHSQYLTSGVLEVRGNFTQRSSYSDISASSNFNASGTHKVLLSGPSVQVIVFADYNCSKFNTLIITKPLDTGYTFNYKPVWNTLVEDESSFDNAYTIIIESEISRAFDFTGDIDFFKFIPLVSGLYSIETTGSTDTVEELYNYDYTLLATNDDLVDLNAKIIYYLDADQTYFTKIWNYNNYDTGTYGFKVVPQYDDNLQSRAIEAGDSLTGIIDCPGDIDIFEFTPTETKEYAIESDSNIDLTGKLYNNSNQIGFDDDSGIDYNFKLIQSLEAGETYQISISGFYKKDTGAYSLYITPYVTEQYGSLLSDSLTEIVEEPINDGISWRSIIAYAEENFDWLKSDWVGREILIAWLFGGDGRLDSLPKQTITDDDGIEVTLPVWDIYTTPAYGKDSANLYWGPYMMKSYKLTNGNPIENSRGLKEILLQEFNDIEMGSIKNISITENIAIENGEQIIGHQYLHGTNAKVGGFKITGTASKESNGKVIAKMHFEWNDVIDPNFQYDTDSLKVQIAQEIPGSSFQNYIAKIAWDHIVIMNTDEPSLWEFWKERSSWPFAE